MEAIEKEVHFDEWCPKCMHWYTDEYEDPCNECLCTPANVYSHKPINWKEGECR